MDLSKHQAKLNEVIEEMKCSQPPECKHIILVFGKPGINGSPFLAIQEMIKQQLEYNHFDVINQKFVD